MITEDDRAQCITLASLLRATALFGWWGFALSCIAAATLAFMAVGMTRLSAMGMGAVAILGVLERYFAFRLLFDERLFDHLARGMLHSTLQLDTALARVGLRPRAPADRPLELRVIGTRRLLNRHGVVIACQTLMFMLAIMTQNLH